MLHTYGYHIVRISYRPMSSCSHVGLWTIIIDSIIDRCGFNLGGGAWSESSQPPDRDTVAPLFGCNISSCAKNVSLFLLCWDFASSVLQNNFLSIKMLPVKSQNFLKTLRGTLGKKLLADLSHLDCRYSVYVVFRVHVEVYGTMIMIQYLESKIYPPKFFKRGESGLWHQICCCMCAEEWFKCLQSHASLRVAFWVVNWKSASSHKNHATDSELVVRNCGGSATQSVG